MAAFMVVVDRDDRSLSYACDENQYDPELQYVVDRCCFTVKAVSTILLPIVQARYCTR